MYFKLLFVVFKRNICVNSQTYVYFCADNKKVKPFISHGGLFSTYEAIFTATPIIGIPLFFDQFDNVRRMAELGVGIHLSYDQVPIIDLKMAIREILNNPK